MRDLPHLRKGSDVGTESRLLLGNRLLGATIKKKMKSQENYFYCYNSQKRASIVPDPLWCRLSLVNNWKSMFI